MTAATDQLVTAHAFSALRLLAAQSDGKAANHRQVCPSAGASIWEQLERRNLVSCDGLAVEITPAGWLEIEQRAGRLPHRAAESLDVIGGARPTTDVRSREVKGYYDDRDGTTTSFYYTSDDLRKIADGLNVAAGWLDARSGK